MARWVMAHQMQVEKERRDLRRWARFVGTDTAAFSESETPVDENAPVHAIPLAAILNPEAFSHLTNTYSKGEEAYVEDDEFERQIEALEKGGLLTEIDSIIGEAEEKAKAKKDQSKKDKDEKALEADLQFLNKVDELTNKAEKMTKAKRRPRIVR